jgi:AcrR family transcriptional regulator
MARIDKLENEKKARILSAAAGEFSRRGYEGGSLARIGEAAGVSKASLYYYFEDKADLYLCVLREAWGFLLPAEATLDLGALDEENFWSELQRHYFALVERTQQAEWLAAAGKLFYSAPPEAGEIVAEWHGRAEAFLAALLRRGQRLGVVRRDLPEGLLLAVVLGSARAADQWIVEHWEEFDVAQREQLVQPVFELFARVTALPGEPE